MPKGARVLPAACLERLRAADLILHAGDLVARSFLDELRGLGPPVEAVHGNVDEPELRALLPKERVVEPGGMRVGMTHVPGPRAGRERRLTARFPGCRAIVYGHTHRQLVTRAGGRLVVNPGAAGARRFDLTPSVARLTIADGHADVELLPLG